MPRRSIGRSGVSAGSCGPVERLPCQVLIGRGHPGRRTVSGKPRKGWPCSTGAGASGANKQNALKLRYFRAFRVSASGQARERKRVLPAEPSKIRKGSSQPLDPFEIIGAPDGNRTRISGLEGRSTSLCATGALCLGLTIIPYTWSICRCNFFLVYH